jgi:hypothetical protein
LRNIFLNLYISEKEFTSKEELIEYINNISKIYKYKKDMDKELNKQIHSSQNQKAKRFFDMLLKLKINDLRNKTVHKYGMRPTDKQVSENLEAVRNIVFPLEELLKIKSVDLYLN